MTEDKPAKPELAMVEAQINWSPDKYTTLLENYEILREWEPEFPQKGKTPIDAPTGKICLYEAFFKYACFRIPTSRFLIDVLQKYGVHITQLSPFGMARVMHYEGTCRAMRREPVFDHFNCFYKLEVKDSGWVSFAERSKSVSFVIKGSSPKSFRDWKRCFFYVRKEVIPVNMDWFTLRSGQQPPSFEFDRHFQQQDWCKILVSHATRLDNLEHCDEGMLRLVGLSRVGMREGMDVLPYGDGGMDLVAGRS